ncbi:MAG: TatD family hydrolase [Sphingobacteriales bacterium]|nr:TatD family hydrolase [Sphingobacteriales bacterium]
MLIDIHTHHFYKENQAVVAITNCTHFDSLQQGYLYSTGIHPWNVTESKWESDFIALQQISILPSVLAIGECGLDKLCNTSWELQLKSFVAQVKWANKIKKPLMIHCVRAYEEIIHLLKEEKNTQRVIFHGFNKGIMLAEKLVNEGYYLSFGKAIQNSRVQSTFKTIPADKIFVETDDSDISIQDIYETAAAIKHISIDELSLQIEKNYATVFPSVF